MILHHPPSSHSNHAGHVEMLCWDLVHTRYEINTSIVRVTMVSEQGGGGEGFSVASAGLGKMTINPLSSRAIVREKYRREKRQGKLCFPPLLCLSPCINSRE